MGPIIAAAGALLAVGGLVGLAMGLFGAARVVWPLLLFEPLCVAAGVLGVAVGFGAQRDTPALGVAITAAGAALAASLGYLGATNTLGTGVLLPLLVARLGLAGLLGLVSARLVLGASRSRWLRAGAGGGLLALGGAMAAVAFLDPGKPIRDWLLSMGGFVASAAGLVLFIVFVAVVSAGVQLLLDPFEWALDHAPNNKPAKSPDHKNTAQSAGDRVGERG